MAPLSPRVFQIVDTLKANGHRVTPQRLAILQAFADSRSHPDVETVFAEVKPKFPTTSLATVYKTVALLKELGEAMEFGFGDGGNRYDVRMPQPHPHLVCLECRKILDSDPDSLTLLTRSLAEQTGFRIIGHRVDVYGICPECQDAASR